MNLRRLLAGLIGIPLALFIVLFAVANRQSVVVGFDPFSPDAPAFSFSLPLYAIVLLCVMLGVFVGGVASWLQQGRRRKEAKSLRGENARLKADKDAARREAAEVRRTALPAPSRRAA